MNKKFVLVLCILAIVSLASNTLALGVTPGRTSLDYSPGQEKDITFTIINSEHKEMTLEVSVQGDMNSSIILESTSIKMESSDEEKKMHAKLIMPNNLSPGKHNANIVIAQKPEKKEGSGQAIIGAVLAVTTQVSIYVPYPGKYLEGEIKVSGTEKNKRFAITLLSLGTEDIGKVGAAIHVYDSSGKEVKILNTNEISLRSSETREIYTDWDVDAPDGRYKAKAVLNYDGQEMSLEKDFEIGEFLLDLQQIFVKDFKLGGIAKFDMLVKNKWNEPITNAYAEMRVYDEQMQEIVDMKSATYNIPAGEQTTMNYYWDTKDVKQGLYNSNVILYYNGKKTQQDLKLDVGQDKIDVIGLGYVISSENSSSGGNKGLVTILIVVIVFLLLVNLALFFVFRKK